MNPDVTEDTITATICVSGWTTTVRPPTSVTNKMKVRSAASYSIGVTNTEYDHLVPLELGGAPDDPRNLWVEPGTIPNPKDDIETKLRKAVCAHLVPLADAQLAIASNWTTAYASLGLAVTGGHACLASEPTRCAP